MNAVVCCILILIVSISPCRAGADDRAVLRFTRDASAASLEPGLLDIPFWAAHIPKDSFVGISQPCSSIEEARRQSLDSAIGNILQAMGAEYQLSHESTLTGDRARARHELKETLSFTARWLLNSVQQHVQEHAFRNATKGVVCFVLVHIRPSELDHLKKLTIGAKLTVRVVGRTDDQATVEVCEANGVGATLAEYRISAETKHGHARFISLFFWKVPGAETRTIDGVLARRLFVKNSLDRVVISLSNDRNWLRSLLMGSKEDPSITLTGYDEIGRSLSIPVRFQ